MNWWYDPVEAAILSRMSFLKEEKDMGIGVKLNDPNLMSKEEIAMVKTLDELVKAIRDDYKWANETSVIFENEMPDFQSPEEKAFLNGVKFATRKYMDILKTNGLGGNEND